MSLLPTERLHIGLTPDSVGVICQRALWRRRREGDCAMIDVGSMEANAHAPVWRGALDALSRWLASRQHSRAAVTLVLSNRFVRFALAPWSNVLAAPEEESELALACLESRYGSMEGWTVRLDTPSYGQPRIVCAIQTSLLDELQEVFAKHKLSHGAILPAFVVGWNRFRHGLDQTKRLEDGIFAMAESGTVVLASRVKNTWRSLRALASPSDWSLLPDLLEREPLLQGFSSTLSAWVAIPGRTREQVANWSERWSLIEAEQVSCAPAFALARLGVVT